MENINGQYLEVVGLRYFPASPESRSDSFAFDGAISARSKDENGFLHVAQSNLTKAVVNPYYGREIPGWQERGLDPTKIYYGYRAAEELEKAAPTFDGLPLLMGHHYESAEEPQKEYRVGSIGTGCHWEPPYVVGALTVTDKDAIDAIENGTAKELSCSYAYDPDFTAGEHEGIAYDFIMRNIRGNHVALVDTGRAGPDVVVADGLPSGMRESEKTQKSHIWEGMMSFFKTKKKTLAKDEELAVEAVETKDEGGVIEKLAAFLSTITDRLTDEERDAVAAMLAEGAKAEDEEEKPLNTAEAVAYGEKEERDKLISEHMKEAADRCGMDAESEEFQKAFAEGVKYGEEMEKAEPKKLDSEHESEGMKKALDEEEVKSAMDAAIKDAGIKAEARLLAKFRSLSKAGEDCRSVLGSVDVMAFDSADDIYGKALAAMGIDTRGYDKSAYRAMFSVAKRGQLSSARIANDRKPSGVMANFKNLRSIER